MLEKIVVKGEYVVSAMFGLDAPVDESLDCVVSDQRMNPVWCLIQSLIGTADLSGVD